MAANQRNVAYMKEVPRLPNGFLKNLRRSPVYSAWKDVVCNSKSLTAEVKTEPCEDELASPKASTEVWLGPENPSGVKFLTPGLSCSVPTSVQKMPIPTANPTNHHVRTNAYQGSSSKSDSRPRTTNVYGGTKQKATYHHVCTNLARGSSSKINYRRPRTIPNSYAGRKRKATNTDLMLLPPPSAAPIDNMKQPVDELFCEVCQASCSSARTLRQHLKGRRHRANLKWRQDKRKSENGSLRCNLCRIFCSDRALLEMHRKGKKHKAKFQALKNGDEIAKKPIRCELCLVSCMDEDLFQMHVNGKPHAVRVELAHMQKSLMYH